MNQHAMRNRRLARRQLETAVTLDNEGNIVNTKVFFVYSVIISAIASGSTGAGQFTVQADSDFLIQQLVGQQIVSNAAVADPYTTIQITDTGSSFNLFDQPQLFRTVFGTATLPFILPAPKLLKRNAAINVNLTNVNSGAAATYYLSFIGQRIYSVGA